VNRLEIPSLWGEIIKKLLRIVIDCTFQSFYARGGRTGFGTLGDESMRQAKSDRKICAKLETWCV